MYAQRRLKSVCASTHSDQSLPCPHEENLHNALSEDSDQTARMRRLIWIFAGSQIWRCFLTYGSLYDGGCHFLGNYPLVNINFTAWFYCFISALSIEKRPYVIHKQGLPRKVSISVQLGHDIRCLFTPEEHVDETRRLWVDSHWRATAHFGVDLG